MPSIVTATQLRSVLGVTSALYSDAYLDDILDTSEQVILPLLQTYSSPISKVSLTDSVATFTTTLIHEFTEGQSVVITGCGSPFNGTRTVLAGETEYTFTASITNADILEKNVIPAGTATLSGAERACRRFSPRTVAQEIVNIYASLCGQDPADIDSGLKHVPGTEGLI